jgi:acyl transferase domain-containing protein
MPTKIDKLIALGRASATASPPDWGTFRAVEFTLVTLAHSDGEKDALAILQSAGFAHEIMVALSVVERTFLEGKPDANGNPRIF